VKEIEELKAKKQFFDDQITNSVKYLSEELGIEFTVSENFQPVWRTYGYYFKCLDYVELNQKDDAVLCLEKAINSYELSTNEIFVSFADNDFLGSEDYQLIRSVFDTPDNNEEAYLFGSFASKVEEEQKKLHTALKILREELPVLYEQVRILMPNILITGPTKTKFITSASTIKLFGCVIIGSYGKNTVTTYLEDLVHESAHHRLFLEQSSDELTLNPPEEKYTAPFRRDKRPMAGLFHAHFVLGQIALAFHKIKASSAVANQSDFETMFESAKRRFVESKSIIDQYGKFTEVGQKIYNNINNQVKMEVLGIAEG
jgi:hypothetical protein